MKYPNRLRELRTAKGLNQADLAKLLGVKQPTVNRHENGNRSLDGFSIEKYATFYKVSPFELFVTQDHEVECDNDDSALDSHTIEELATV